MRNTVAKRLRKEARNLTTNFAFDLLEKVTFKRGRMEKFPVLLCYMERVLFAEPTKNSKQQER